MFRNGWGVTAIDTLSTALILGDADTVNEILEFVPTVDFTTTKKFNDSVSVFESNIRYLGGLLSGTFQAHIPLVNSPRLLSLRLRSPEGAHEGPGI